MRLKNENECLKVELDNKNKSIEMLKTTVEECKNQLDKEKFSLQEKYEEIENNEVSIDTVFI